MTSYHIKLERCAAAKDRLYIKHLFFTLIEEFNLHIRAVTRHCFYSEGLSVAAILAEGHAFMQTWPLEERVYIDLHCYSELEHDFTERFLDEVLSLFGAKSLLYMITDRITMTPIDEGDWSKGT
jgi:S-adenosylmethionine/arginine decarboxylase-like enzyme